VDESAIRGLERSVMFNLKLDLFCVEWRMFKRIHDQRAREKEKFQMQIFMSTSDKQGSFVFSCQYRASMYSF